jgi:hypothetical protein
MHKRWFHLGNDGASLGTSMLSDLTPALDMTHPLRERFGGQTRRPSWGGHLGDINGNEEGV